MDKNAIIDAATSGADYGFEIGFKTAASFVKSLTENIDDPNMQKWPG